MELGYDFHSQAQIPRLCKQAMKEVGFGTLFVQRKISENDKIVLPYLDAVVWGCSMVNVARKELGVQRQTLDGCATQEIDMGKSG